MAAQPLILFDRGSSDWTLSHGLFRRAGLVPNVVLEVESIEAAKRMVERGIGLAFLPQLAVVREIRRRRLIAVDVRDAEPLEPQPRRHPSAPASARHRGPGAAQDVAGRRRRDGPRAASAIARAPALG